MAIETQVAAGHAALTPERFSALRHDLRTPFNQIIGYAEMAGEEAEDAGAKTVTLAAGELVAVAHQVLEQLTSGLSGDAAEVTDESLSAMRQAMAAPLRTLSEKLAALRAAAASEGCSDEVEPNLAHVDSAICTLGELIAASEHWLDVAGNASPVVKDTAPKPAQNPRPREQAQSTPATETSAALAVQERNGAPNAQTAASRNGASDPAQKEQPMILIVDDHAENRDLLRQRLTREGFRTLEAADGLEALTVLEQQSVDLVLLDVLMPGLNGIEVLRRIKSSEHGKSIPVIMISALNEIESVVACIESGAEDYLSKPFNPVLLRARIGVTLERKRLRDEEKKQHEEMARTLEELARERENAHNLLLNILPAKVAAELQQGHTSPMYFEDCTICFTDFVGFTLSTENMAAELVVEELHTFFTAFDRIMERYGLEKMKTIGDSYMFASGLPQRNPANPVNAILAAFELVYETERLAEREDAPGWKLRIGLHTGPVIAGVVGIRKFAFDIWGDSVNFASRMESSGAANAINVSERTYVRIKDFFVCEHRGKVTTKDKREVDMYFVRGIQPSLIRDGSSAAFERRYKLYFNEEAPSFPAFLLNSAQ